MTRRRAHGSAVSVEVFSMPRKILRRLGRASRLLLTSGLLLALSPAAGASSQGLTGDIWAHDPSLIQWNGCYYAFSTGHPPLNEGTITIRRACGDLSGPWELIGTVFDAQPEWIAREIGTKPRHLWAPDISYHNGKFYLYYAGSTFGSNVSVIGLATNTTLDPQDPDYQWIDEGMVIRSYRHNNYNAIDPEVFWGEGEAWLLFGSWWDGIKMRGSTPRPASPRTKTRLSTPWPHAKAQESKRPPSCTATGTITSLSPLTAAAPVVTAPTIFASAEPRPSPVPTTTETGCRCSKAGVPSSWAAGISPPWTAEPCT